jgi:hypothetical protein
MGMRKKVNCTLSDPLPTFLNVSNNNGGLNLGFNQKISSIIVSLVSYHISIFYGKISSKLSE